MSIEKSGIAERVKGILACSEGSQPISRIFRPSFSTIDFYYDSFLLVFTPINQVGFNSAEVVQYS